MSSLDLPEQSRVIGGLTYTVQPLSARKSLQVLTRVLKMAGPGFGDAAHLSDASNALLRALEGFAEHLDENVLIFVCDAFAEVSRVETAPGRELPLAKQYDDHFRGRPAELFEWIAFAAEVSFGPLGDALRRWVPRIVERVSSRDAPGAQPAAG